MVADSARDSYAVFLERKTHLAGDFGFEPSVMPDFLFPFQRALVEWAVRKGRAAIFADCGLGKTAMQLVWAQNVVKRLGKPVLILTPLAVGAQTVQEARKWGIEAEQSRNGKVTAEMTVTNYQQLHKFDWSEFGGVVCDESSILKNSDGVLRGVVTDFMRKVPLRLLCTATAAPNDYVELGTSSEALGGLGMMDMLGRFFKQDANFVAIDRRRGDGRVDVGSFGKYRFRGHAEEDFWRWVCSWARAIRRPADLGFANDGYVLPPLETVEHVISAKTRNPEYLFEMAAIGLQEQRAERRRTVEERCEKAAAQIVGTGRPAVAWCHLNEEGRLLRELIPDAVEVCGADSDERKEEAFAAFAAGQARVLVSKPVIAGFGLNWQHCAHQTYFPSHSFEQWYQAVRRCWRFGQRNAVTVDVIASEGEAGILSNLKRKAAQADAMFQRLVELMHRELKIDHKISYNEREEIPEWLS